MKISVFEILDEGLIVRASAKDDWFFNVLSDATDRRFGTGLEANVYVRFTRYEGNVNVDGEIVFSTRCQCDRCLKEYLRRQVLPLHFVLIPKNSELAARSKFKVDEESLVKDDIGFGTYENESIDVSMLVRDAVVLSEPMKYLCSEDCKGLCQHCGKDLNTGPCRCVEKKASPTWDVLKNLKLPTGNRSKSKARPKTKVSAKNKVRKKSAKARNKAR